ALEEHPVALGRGTVDRAAEDVALLPQLDDALLEGREAYVGRDFIEHRAHHSPVRTRETTKRPSRVTVGAPGERGTTQLRRCSGLSGCLRQPGAVTRAARLRLLGRARWRAPFRGAARGGYRSAPCTAGLSPSPARCGADSRAACSRRSHPRTPTPWVPREGDETHIITGACALQEKAKARILNASSSNGVRQSDLLPFLAKQDHASALPVRHPWSSMPDLRHPGEPKLICSGADEYHQARRSRATT